MSVDILTATGWILGRCIKSPFCPLEIQTSSYLICLQPCRPGKRAGFSHLKVARWDHDLPLVFYEWQLEPPREQDIHLPRTSPGIVLDPRLHMWFKCFAARTNLTENNPPLIKPDKEPFIWTPCVGKRAGQGVLAPGLVAQLIRSRWV